MKKSLPFALLFALPLVSLGCQSHVHGYASEMQKEREMQVKEREAEATLVEAQAKLVEAQAKVLEAQDKLKSQETPKP